MIDSLRRDERVVGVVLRVDSPGGDGLASDLLHHQLERLRREKPVVVSMGEVAASGGYYLSAAGDSVLADRIRHGLELLLVEALAWLARVGGDALEDDVEGGGVAPLPSPGCVRVGTAAGGGRGGDQRAESPAEGGTALRCRGHAGAFPEAPRRAADSSWRLGS